MRDYGNEVIYIVLVIYDISDNKHRQKMAKYLESYGHRVQKSCFEARLNKKQYGEMLSGLEKRVREEDNLRIYQIRSYEEIKLFGSKDYSMEEDVIII